MQSVIERRGKKDFRKLNVGKSGVERGGAQIIWRFFCAGVKKFLGRVGCICYNINLVYYCENKLEYLTGGQIFGRQDSKS